MADKNTLNGALEELGKLMATNLTTKGVASTYDMGLTTLANRILLINGGGELTISLTSDKDILSYADSDSATLTATVLEDSSAVSGETVDFYRYVDGTNDVLLGSDVTDSNGEASYTYASTGVGDIQVYAKVRTLVSKTYDIQDTFKYYPNEISKTSTSTGSYIFTPLFDGFSFVSDSFVAEFDIKVDGNGVGVSISSTANNNKFLWLANQIQSQISKKVLYYRDSANAEKSEYYNIMDTNTYYHIKLEYSNSELKVYDETGLLSTIIGLTHYNGDTRSIYFGEWVRNHTVTIKNVLIKPL